MSIKSILVPITGSDVGRPALEAAFVLARQFDAHIEGLNVSSERAEIQLFRQSQLDKTAHQEALKALEAQAAEKVEEARRLFDDFIAQKSIEVSDDPADSGHPTVSWQVAVGRGGDVVGQVGGAFDLVVVALPSAVPEQTSRETLEAAVFNTGRPVLLAPASLPESLTRSIVIGWNRSVQAGRALFAAMPFLALAERIQIVTVTTGAKRGPSHLDIARNLAWHGINAQIREIAPDQRPVGEVLLSEAADFGADLLVMGAYSESRMRERIVGGVTRQILSRAELPVLMAR
jgi:nucleotide-binding universal stress UspA family protein